MKDQIEKPESGAVGQPGEKTTSKADTLTSNGISSLLTSEFAKEDTAEAGKETPPAHQRDAGPSDGKKADEQHHEQEQAEKELAERAEAAGKTVDEQRADEAAEATEQTRLETKAKELNKTVEEVQALEAEEADKALPPEMQTALDEWEAKGGPLPESVQRVVNKRIGRLTEEKVAAETRANGLEAALKTAQAENETLRNDPNRPAQPNPFGIPNEQDLAKTERAAKKFLDQAEAYLDDTATPQEREQMERFMQQSGLDANGLKRRVREVNGYLRDELPSQKEQVRTFKAAEQQASAQARRDFAWLADANAPEQKVKAKMLKLLPDLPKRLPNHELVLGIYMLGYKQYEQQLKAAATAKGKPAAKTPPPRVPAGTGAARQTPARAKASDTASEAFSKAPTRENAANLARAALMEA
jgi:hypothetical protein